MHDTLAELAAVKTAPRGDTARPTPSGSCPNNAS